VAVLEGQRTRASGARYGMTQRLPQGFSRNEIEPVRPKIADAKAGVSRKTGQPDRRYVRGRSARARDPTCAVARLQVVGAGESSRAGETLPTTGPGGAGVCPLPLARSTARFAMMRLSAGSTTWRCRRCSVTRRM
jgi:hypothetical protein